MRLALCSLLLSSLLTTIVPGGVQAGDQIAMAKMNDGTAFPYVLTTSDGEKPRYAVILMPGGSGNLAPRMDGTRLALAAGGNFLIRSRAIFAEGPFVAVSTDQTTTPDRIMAIVRDLDRRFGSLQVYVAGTSTSTNATLSLSEPLDGKVAGFIHTSSFNRVASLDPRKLKSRHLIVLHKQDACQYTKPSAGASSHSRYGTDIIEMEGGKSTDTDCEAFSYHGYNGIERETVTKIKAWISAK
jgi:hypothetical protein